MRSFLLGMFSLLFSGLLAQRDTTIDGVKLHLLQQQNSDTISTIWITGLAATTGTYYEIYPNGKIKCKGNKNQGDNAGTWDEFYPNGQLRSHGLYQKGLKNGIWRYYYESGKNFSSGNYTRDQRDGLWKTWYENDSLASRGQYWHDYCTGTWNWYYDNGKLKAHANYRARSKLMDKKTAKYSTVPAGKTLLPRMKKQYTFFNVDSLVEYYPNGKLRSRIMYDKNGKRVGTAKFWFENGQLNHEEYYKDLNPAGCWIYYCEDGSIHSQIDYGNGGPCDRNGEFSSSCSYSGDIMPLIQHDWIIYPQVRVKF